MDIDPRDFTQEEVDWFWSQVQIGGSSSIEKSQIGLDTDCCWPYVGKGSRDKQGYVRVSFHGRSYLAHRLAYVLSGGALGEQLALHSCDVTCCVAPHHLSAGTAAENNRQRDERGRRTPFLPRGAASPSAKLTEREVTAIRRAREQGIKVAVLASIFGVSNATISNVHRGVYYGGSTTASTA